MPSNEFHDFASQAAENPFIAAAYNKFARAETFPDFLQKVESAVGFTDAFGYRRGRRLRSMAANASAAAEIG